MLRALVVTHGELASALLATARTVVGDFEGVEAMSNHGHSRDSLQRAVAEHCAGWGEEGGVVLTDVVGGSCTQAVLSAAATNARVGVVAGVNLAMVIDFLMHREEFDARAMAERLEQKGKASVRSFPPRPVGGAAAGGA